MASSEQLKALIRSHIQGDEDQFYSVAMQVAAREAKIGHGNLAIEIRDMIDAAKSKHAIGNSGRVFDIAKPRGELAGLLSVSYPKNRLVDMVLAPTPRAQLVQVIKEQHKLVRIREFGLAPRRKLLLIGPPGTGKTMTASALAGELGLPLFLVRLDSLLTKFMGETAAKLRQVFDSLSEMRGVYFFDEFDAIGSQRGMTNDVGEIRRVLNSFLQMIEHDQSNSLIVAATNHPEILDYALHRRFDDVIAYDLPDASQIEGLVIRRLGGFAPLRIGMKSIVSKADGLSYAEICRAIDGAIKEAIMQDRRHVLAADLSRMILERVQITEKLSKRKY
jgi:SpoVK/Ycf46/Vps4 family AAA+-type ATPase